MNRERLRLPLNTGVHGKPWLSFILIFTACLVLAGCADSTRNIRNLKMGRGRSIVAFGDSITAGYGVEANQAYPEIVAQILGLPIINRGVNGDTTATARQRLEEDVIAEDPWMVIVELGGNDFLTHVPKTTTASNLKVIVETLQARGSVVVLLQMNIGLFVDEYGKIYKDIAHETGAMLIPGVLDDILDHASRRQDDRIHPNAEGHRLMGERVAKALKPVLKRAVWPPALLPYRKF